MRQKSLSIRTRFDLSWFNEDIADAACCLDHIGSDLLTNFLPEVANMYVKRPIKGLKLTPQRVFAKSFARDNRACRTHEKFQQIELNGSQFHLTIVDCYMSRVYVYLNRANLNEAGIRRCLRAQ